MTFEYLIAIVATLKINGSMLYRDIHVIAEKELSNIENINEVKQKICDDNGLSSLTILNIIPLEKKVIVTPN